jgi:putative DNA primase/helicase
LLLHLCDGNAELASWITRWIAYPLQHPGAKMTTSVIMHGDEGSGKNLFWEQIVRQLYGEYGGVIGNAQIEASFNEWASMKLFMVADEVVTRNELRQLKGKLKGMITGEEIRINPKNLPERSEANHINFVFLSNELQPLALDKTDRRYLVVWTPAKRDLAYYKEVGDEIDAGGIAAFYHYLLHEVDCGDMNEHTKPLETMAKHKLISLGLSAPERFYREWVANATPLPFVCCAAMDLYAAFQRWSHLNGERWPPSQAEFGGKVERIAAGEVKRKMIKYPLGEEVKQRTVYLVGEKPEGQTYADWVEGPSALFQSFLKKYRHVYDQSDE